MKLRFISRAVLVLPLLAAAALAQSAPTPIKVKPAVPTANVLPANTFAGGPAIPTTPPAESPHPESVLLWPNGAPGSEAHKDEAEIVGWRQEVDIVFPIVYNIHNPSITPFLPTKDKATGCAVVIAPGGGHMFQTIDREGYDLAKWLADHGVAAFVLNAASLGMMALHRARPSHANIAKFAGADGMRAIRLVRSRAAEWGVDPNRVGLMGFSAGGEVTLDTALADGQGDPSAADLVDRQDGHPSFLGIIYSSPPRAADWTPPANFPPSFLLCSSTDPSATVSGANGLTRLYGLLHTANIPVELHIYEEGGHGFGVRQWAYSVSGWPNLFYGWLNDRGYLKKR